MTTVPNLYFDGGSRGNPGNAGSGAILKLDTTILGTRIYKFPRRATNNEAEYMGLIQGVKLATELGYKRIRIHGDSLLVVKQILGLWRVKHPRLRPLYNEALKALALLDGYDIRHVPREQNKEADALANEAMDSIGSF